MTLDRSERLKNLSPAKRELLLKAIQENKATTGEMTFLSRSFHQEPTSLSFGQQRMWFLQQWEPRSSLYNIPVALRLMGRLDRLVLKQSLEEIIQRHESLRTTFEAREGLPSQMIHAPSVLALPVFDLRGMALTLRESLTSELARSETQQVFDLHQGPLLRVSLVQHAEDEHILFLTIHHIVTDGWSMQILLEELCTLYKAFSQGLPSPLENLTLQYADYTHWQRQWLQGPVLERQLHYWKKQLADLPTLELPLDYPRPVVPNFHGSSFPFILPPPLVQRIHQLSKQEKVTPFVVLLTAFQVMLARYSHQNDIVLGTPVANRNRKELERLIGYFSNMLVLRTNLSGNPTFYEALLRVHNICLDAYTYQDLPFERLVEELQPERDPSRNPLFQVMFALQNEPMAKAELPELILEEWEIESSISRLDLSLNMTELPDGRGLAGEVEYCTSLFSSDTIALLIKRYHTLLESILSHPEQHILELPILTEDEKLRYSLWNTTSTNYPRNLCLHELFEAQVAHTPEATAITFGEQQVTYGYLNERANKLAFYLQTLGAGPETLVGICLDRSLEMVLAVLGVLKTGAAYIPLDPAYPQERLTFILNDAKVPILLTHDQLHGWSPDDQVRVIHWDGNFEEMLNQLSTAHQDGEGFSSNILAGNLAYVIYTSGSTGIPKGVAVPHTAIVNRLLWGQSAYPLTNVDRVLQIAPFSFDISIWEIFGPLLAGARLTLARSDGHYDTRYLVGLMAEQKVTVAHFVPTTLRMLLEEVCLRENCSLRAIFCGGDIVPADLPENTVAQLNVDFYQFYGPTEAAINSTFWNYQSGNIRHKVPIGRPIANTQIYLLDAYLQPVPVGTPGEIYIGGFGIARGYLNQSHLTAERFIPHPFSSEPGERLYKTGDLARYQPDGNLEFLNRTDTQVKIRGHRIELSEIEIVLNTHPAVREAVVLPREDTPGLKRLIAYIVLQVDHLPLVADSLLPDNQRQDRKESFHQRLLKDEDPLRQGKSDFLQLTSDLRTYLESRLPKYMMPATFVMLDSLPLNPNGKVDRRSLPPPEEVFSGRDDGQFLPRTDVEWTLAGIFQRVLHVTQVGVYDNFFELGGHSLLATQAISEIREAFHVELSLPAFFEKPTIASLVVVLAQSENRKTASLPAIKRAYKGEAEQLIETLDQLSDDAIDALFADRFLKEKDQ